MINGIEYYKHIQNGAFNIFLKTNPNLSGYQSKERSMAFKKLRRDSTEFQNFWNLQLRAFQRTFKKHFPIYEMSDSVTFNAGILSSFNGIDHDFGDRLLYEFTIHSRSPYIISNDHDFESFDGRLYLIKL